MSNATQNKLSFLVIDDDLGDRKNIVRALKKSNLADEIFEAAGIPQSLPLLEGNEIGCVFVDYNMPSANGIEGLSKLKAIAPHVPVIMVTGQGDELLATEALKKGAADYIPKANIDAEVVRNSVARVMEIATLEKQVRDQREALSSFSRTLAHDLRAPVRHIRIMGETVERAIADRKTESAGELFSRMLKMVDRIDDLVTTLDEYNRSQIPEVTFEPLSLQSILDAAKENLRVEIEAAEAEITQDNLPDVVGNEALLIQLFQNLIGNAVKFSREKVPTVHIGILSDAEVPTFLVRDNGIGIDSKYAKEIFEPFKRLNPIGQFPGSGLGLATCHKILERHQGEIWCDSVFGEGTTFFFTLPMSP